MFSKASIERIKHTLMELKEILKNFNKFLIVKIITGSFSMKMMMTMITKMMNMIYMKKS